MGMVQIPRKAGGGWWGVWQCRGVSNGCGNRLRKVESTAQDEMKNGSFARADTRGVGVPEHTAFSTSRAFDQELSRATSSWAALSRSMTTIGPPQCGQRHAVSQVFASGTGTWATASSWRHSASEAERWRL